VTSFEEYRMCRVRRRNVRRKMPSKKKTEPKPEKVKDVEVKPDPRLRDSMPFSDRSRRVRTFVNDRRVRREKEDA
jgi:hypothetical protein